MARTTHATSDMAETALAMSDPPDHASSCRRSAIVSLLQTEARETAQEDSVNPLSSPRRVVVRLGLCGLCQTAGYVIPQMYLRSEGEAIMRLEATVPDNRGAAVLELAEELGLSRSQLIDEALALFMKALMEVRRGRRLVTLDPHSSQPACELATPTLSALEWTMRPEKIDLPAKALARMQELVKAPPKPGARLRAAAKRHSR